MAQTEAHSPIKVAESFACEWSTTDAPLDFSPASLNVVLALVTAIFTSSDDTTVATSSRGADELVRASCYIGDVVRRSLGGEWASAGGGADMLRGVAGREGDAGVVIPLSELMLVISNPAQSISAWYEGIASGPRI